MAKNRHLFPAPVQRALRLSHGALYLLAVLPGLAFFTIYTRPDVRVTATHWIYQHIPSDSHLLFDTGNVIDIPLGLPDEPSSKPRPSYSMKSFDFYHLDENPELEEELLIHLEKADYIFLPSRRIFANYMRLPNEYPLTTRYYELLFNGSLGFEPVATFTSFPSLGPLSFPDEQAEETSTVFDHPVVRIYKKVKPLEVSTYKTLLKNEK